MRIKFQFFSPPSVSTTAGDQKLSPVDIENEGFFYRMITRFHDYSLGRSEAGQSLHWKNGVVLRGSRGALALLEARGHEIYLSVQSNNLPCFLMNLIVEEVFYLKDAFLPGTELRLAFSCYPVCPLLPRGRCYFKEQRLLRALRRREGSQEIDCEEEGCPNGAISVHELLTGIPLGAHELRRDIQIIRNLLNDEASSAPRLATIEKEEHMVTIKVRITLFCEHSGKSVPELWKELGEIARGYYEIDIQKEFFRKTLWALSIGGAVINIFGGIAIPGVDNSAIGVDGDILGDLVDPEHLVEIEDDFDTNMSPLNYRQAQLRQFHKLLELAKPKMSMDTEGWLEC